MRQLEVFLNQLRTTGQFQLNRAGFSIITLLHTSIFFSSELSTCGAQISTQYIVYVLQLKEASHIHKQKERYNSLYPYLAVVEIIFKPNLYWVMVTLLSTLLPLSSRHDLALLSALFQPVRASFATSIIRTPYSQSSLDNAKRT